MERKFKKTGKDYEMTTIITEEELLIKRKTAIRGIQDFRMLMKRKETLLAEINLALGRDAKDETE